MDVEFECAATPAGGQNSSALGGAGGATLDCGEVPARAAAASPDDAVHCDVLQGYSPAAVAASSPQSNDLAMTAAAVATHPSPTQLASQYGQHVSGASRYGVSSYGVP